MKNAYNTDVLAIASMHNMLTLNFRRKQHNQLLQKNMKTTIAHFRYIKIQS